MSKNEGGAPDAAAEAERQAAETRTAPKGVKGAIETIRNTVDEGAHVLWTTSGPRNSHIAEIGCVLVTQGEIPAMYVVAVYDSGEFKLYHPVPGKTGAAQCAML